MKNKKLLTSTLIKCGVVLSIPLFCGCIFAHNQHKSGKYSKYEQFSSVSTSLNENSENLNDKVMNLKNIEVIKGILGIDLSSEVISAKEAINKAKTDEEKKEIQNNTVALICKKIGVWNWMGTIEDDERTFGKDISMVVEKGKKFVINAKNIEELDKAQKYVDAIHAIKLACCYPANKDDVLNSKANIANAKVNASNKISTLANFDQNLKDKALNDIAKAKTFEEIIVVLQSSLEIDLLKGNKITN